MTLDSTFNGWMFLAGLLSQGGLFYWLIKRLIDKVETIGTEVTIMRAEHDIMKETGICAPVQIHEEKYHISKE